MTTVLVTATRAIGRARLEALGTTGRLRVFAGALGAAPAEQVVHLAPDVLVLDDENPDLRPTLRELARLPRAPAVIVLTREPAGRLDADALRLGVRAVLPRDATLDEVAAAIEAVAAGLIVLHPAAAGTLRSPRATVGRPVDQSLTTRETEVLGMVADGQGNKAIAARLGISERTVKFHVASIFAKLGAGSRTAAVTIGLRRGVILI